MNKSKDIIAAALPKELCIICCKKQSGPIIINTRLTEHEAKQVKELHNKVIGFAPKPCDSCKSDLNKSFLFIGYDEEKSDLDNLPEGFYRTGHIVGVKKDIPLVQEWVKENSPSSIQKGYVFIPYKIMQRLNLIN